MLINFYDTYTASIAEGYKVFSKVHLKIANKETFVGNSKSLDRSYALATVIMGIINVLENDDNSNPISNETFLNELNYLLTFNIC